MECVGSVVAAQAQWDLSSLTRDRIHIPFIGRRILNHWTTREVFAYNNFKWSITDKSFKSLCCTLEYMIIKQLHFN